MRKKRTPSPKKSKNDISEFISAAKIIKLNPKTIGILFTSFGLILLLSIISYSQDDITTWSSLDEIIGGTLTENWLGIVGANISRFFFMYTFGYSSLIFPVWFLYIGIQTFKQVKHHLVFPEKSWLYVHITLITAILLAFPESYRTLGHSVSYYPSGIISGLFSDLMVRMFGPIGSIVVLSSYVLGIVIYYLPKGIKLKLSNPFSKLKMPKVQLDREEVTEPEETEEEPIAEVTEINHPTVVYNEDSDSFSKEEETTSLPEKTEKNIESFQKKIPELAVETETTASEASVSEIEIEQKEAETREDISPIQSEAEHTFSEKNAERISRKTIPTRKENRVEDDQLSKILDNMPDEPVQIEELFKSQLSKQEEKHKQESDAFIQSLQPEDEKAEMSEEPFVDEPDEGIFPESLEEETVPKIEFTIENAVEEKEDNLDKVQKKLSKRERYTYPSVEILNDPPANQPEVSEEELWRNAKILEDKLLDFKVSAKVVNVLSGPVITMFELKPDVGVRVSKIETLMPDISLSLSARGIRFLGQVPGSDRLGIEIPNHHRKLVTFKEIVNSEKFVKSKYELPIVLGKAVNGEIVVADLASMPHLLIAGATGSGKSVGVNSIIASLLYRKHPDDLKFVMIDPKMIELSLYNRLENHHLAYSTELDEKVVTTSENGLAILFAVVEEMEERYRYLKDVAVRNIVEFNTRIAGKPVDEDDPDQGVHEKMPYIVVVIDELADLMMTTNKAVEEPIARLTQKARAVGIHCIVATQRPSVDVITGIIKANIPTRIAFQTASKIDSRTILDLMGAEQLLGKGDMLFLPPGQAKAVRIQNSFLSTEETEDIVSHVAMQPFSRRMDLKLVKEGTQPPSNSKNGLGSGEPSGEKDALFNDAKNLVIDSGQASTSYIQRRLKVGYARAGRIMDQLEDAGIVGPPNGSSPREVLVSSGFDTLDDL